MAEKKIGQDPPKRKTKGRRKHSSQTRSRRSISHSHAPSHGIQLKDVNFTKMLDALKPHDHLCLIYESPEEWRAAAVPFIAVGLRRGEKCLYIADTSTADEIRKYLAEEGIDAASAEKSGQLSILHQAEVYTREGSFDPDSMIAFLIKECEKAVVEGYPALRVTGEMTWVLRGHPGSEKLLEYEAKLNRDFFPHHSCLAICQYDRWKFDPEVIKGIIMTHPLIVHGNHTYQNFYYMPPEKFLNQKRAELEVQHWLNILEREHNMQEMLRRSEERFSTLAEQSLTGLVVVQDFRIVYANAAYAQLTGYTVDELLSLPTEKAQALVHREDQALVWQNFNDQLAGKAVPPRYECRGIRKDGTVYWIEIHSNRIEYDGKPAIQAACIDRTDYKQAEEALRQSEERYRQLTENAGEAIVVAQDGEVKYINPKGAEFSGYSVAELLSMPFAKFIHPDDMTLMADRYARRIEGEPVPQIYDFRFIRKDGLVRWGEFNAVPISWEDRPAMLSFISDITERKNAEETLRQSEERYRTILEEMEEGYYEQDLAGNFIFVNDAMCRHLGYSKDELVWMNYRTYTPKDDVARRRTLWRKVYETGEPVKELRLENIRKDGTRILVEDSVFPLRNQKCEIIGFRGVERDITERRKAEEALKQSEERYRQLTENAGEAIFVAQDGEVKFMNPKAVELSGYSMEDVTSKPFVEFAHPDDIALLVDHYDRRLKGEKVPQTYDVRVVAKDGHVRWGHLNVVLISWEGRPAVLCFMSDITERKQAEEALRLSEERYRTILEQIEEGYYEQDLAGNFTFVNDAMCRHLGYSRDELIGMNYQTYTPKEDVDRRRSLWEKIRQTGEPLKELIMENICKDGTHRFVERSVFPLRNEQGEIIGFRGVGRDITERKQMEEQLIFTDRLASIGQLASGIAHELNNPLTSVIGFSDLLLEKDLPPDVIADLHTVSEEAKRAVAVVKGLLVFARQQRVEKTLVNINSIIQGVLRLRAYEQKVSNIEVEAGFAPSLPQVMGNILQLQQVFLNIIINAEQSMIEAHGRGKLTIATEQVGEMVRASITDDGPGISPQNIKRLFIPFFTTREVGKGTGLGLSICHGIIIEHGGKIYATSEFGKGASFVVELPVST